MPISVCRMTLQEYPHRKIKQADAHEYQEQMSTSQIGINQPNTSNLRKIHTLKIHTAKMAVPLKLPNKLCL